MDEIGPVDYAVIAFPGNQFKGEIAPALSDLVEAGTIRLIDAAFVSKDENGDVLAFELTELAPDVQEALDALNIEVQGLFNDEELLAAGHGARAGLLGGTPGLGERLGPSGRPGDARRGWSSGRVRACPARRRPGSARVGAGRGQGLTQTGGLK